MYRLLWLAITLQRLYVKHLLGKIHQISRSLVIKLIFLLKQQKASNLIKSRTKFYYTFSVANIPGSSNYCGTIDSRQRNEVGKCVVWVTLLLLAEVSVWKSKSTSLEEKDKNKIGSEKQFCIIFKGGTILCDNRSITSPSLDVM